MLTEAAKRKLSMLIPRLASDQPGEVTATVSQMVRVLKAEGADLHDVVKAMTSEPTVVYRTVFQEAQKPDGEWLTKAKFCDARADQLNPKEKEFVADMAIRLKHTKQPTEKQAAWLDAIYHRIQRRNEASA